jgi:hypothetical protein
MEEGEAGLAQPIIRQAAQTEGYEPLALHSQVSACGTNCRTAELPLALHSHESARGVKLGDRIPRASTAPAANFSRVNMDVSSTLLRWHRSATLRRTTRCFAVVYFLSDVSPRRYGAFPCNLRRCRYPLSTRLEERVALRDNVWKDELRALLSS